MVTGAFNFSDLARVERIKHNYCRFVKTNRDEKLFILTWAVDFVMAEKIPTQINNLKSSLESKYKMDERGDLERFIGKRILKTQKGINLDLEKYTQNNLGQFNLQDCKSSKLPSEKNLKVEIAQQDSVRVDSREFRRPLFYLAKQIISLGSQMSYHASWITQLLSVSIVASECWDTYNILNLWLFSHQPVTTLYLSKQMHTRVETWIIGDQPQDTIQKWETVGVCQFVSHEPTKCHSHTVRQNTRF